MDLTSIKHAFAGQQSGGGIERHNLKSLSRRLMVPKREPPKHYWKVASWNFKPSSRLALGATRAGVFLRVTWTAPGRMLSTAWLKKFSRSLEGLDVDEQEKVLAVLTGLRAHKTSVEHEFARKTANDDEDTSPLSKFAGAGVGATAGAALGGRFFVLSGWSVAGRWAVSQVTKLVPDKNPGTCGSVRA